MSQPARFLFLPYLRRGAATLIGGHAGLSLPTPRVVLETRLDIAQNIGGNATLTRPLELYGSGEISGFDARAVTRTWPGRAVKDAETNSFAHIEFDQPDLPWRFTPYQARGAGFVPPIDGHHFSPDPTRANTDDDGIDRLRPWCVLIVLRPEQILEYRPAATKPPSGDPPPLSILKTAQRYLPALEQSWAWAHVQVTGRADLSDAEALALFETAPHLFVSRIICPLRLEPRVDYRAFLVPAFERGKIAGLGNDPGSRVPAAMPAWGSPDAMTDDVVSLPVYYEWGFQTAPDTGFESLVKSLKATPLPDGVGWRAIDASAPDAEVPTVAPDLAIGGALRPIDPLPIWDPTAQAAFVTPFADELNRPAKLLTGVGNPHLVPPIYGRWLAAREDVEPESSAWADVVNVDPRNRIAAGAGSAVVQKHDEKLMVAAWRQIEGLQEINDKLRFAQLARELSRRIHARRIGGAGTDAFLLLAAPLFRRVRDAGVTIAKRLDGSRIGGALEPAFRKIARRRRRAEVPASPALFDRINTGELVAAPVPQTPLVVTTADVFSTTVGGAPPRPSFSLVTNVGPGQALPSDQASTTGASDSSEGAQFRGAIIDALNDIHAPRLLAPSAVSIDIAAIRQRITDVIDPGAALVMSFQSRLHFAPGFVRATTDPLEPILAAPSFEQPMYEPLRGLSEEWILPGLGALKNNSITLAEVNQEFIEAYMLGLNHELGRALLWRDYPTDQRGTFFRKFWETRGYDGPRTEEELRDIHPIDAWPPANPLGANSARPPLPGGEPPLVLVLRGDLLRQYPTAIVYASRAQREGTALEPAVPADERHPIFRGTLGGDIAFFGFELTADEARGADDGSDDGWFFVLQEQPNEPRFGFENGPASPAAMTWDALQWDQVSPLPIIRCINLFDPNLPFDVAQTSAKIADATLRDSVRVAVHARDMLPVVTP
jgi:hypothetical protein